MLRSVNLSSLNFSSRFLTSHFFFLYSSLLFLLLSFSIPHQQYVTHYLSYITVSVYRLRSHLPIALTYDLFLSVIPPNTEYRWLYLLRAKSGTDFLRPEEAEVRRVNVGVIYIAFSVFGTLKGVLKGNEI